MTLGDRIAVMKDGAVQRFGTPDDIYARPATRFVAEFIGSPAMNMIAAQPSAAGLAALKARAGFHRRRRSVDDRSAVAGAA